MLPTKMPGSHQPLQTCSATTADAAGQSVVSLGWDIPHSLTTLFLHGALKIVVWNRSVLDLLIFGSACSL